ncbi:MAG TPA: hypothetical protein VII57_02010 [Dehalococcoidia bacterium]
MDNDYVLNLDDILRTIASAEVVRFRFGLLDKRLLIDNRCNELEGPLVKLVDRAGSSEESFRNLKRLRPRFPLPDKMTAIWWPKYVSTLRSTGVWEAIVSRIADAGFADAVRQSEDALRELLRMEREEIRNAITGVGFQTIWPRPVR